MRASKLLEKMQAETMAFSTDGTWPDRRLVELARILAAQERAIEALAEDAGAGPARRIKAILDGEE